MRVDDIGLHIPCFAPRGRSLVTMGMPGVTSTSQFSGMSRRVATSVISLDRRPFLFLTSCMERPHVMRKAPACLPVSGGSGSIGCLVPVSPLPRRSTRSNRRHALLKRLRSSQFWLFEVPAPRSSRSITAHGRSFHPHASPLDEAPHCEDKEDAEAQDIAPESQQESQDYGGHIVVPERLLYKKLKSSADEEQQAGTSNNPSRPLELSVLPSLVIHKITTGVLPSLPLHSVRSLSAGSQSPR